MIQCAIISRYKSLIRWQGSTSWKQNHNRSYQKKYRFLVQFYETAAAWFGRNRKVRYVAAEIIETCSLLHSTGGYFVVRTFLRFYLKDKADGTWTKYASTGMVRRWSRPQFNKQLLFRGNGIRSVGSLFSDENYVHYKL